MTPPAPPSREAEIAAEQLIERISTHILGNPFGADDCDVWNDAERWVAEALSPLLAQLQQAREALEHVQHGSDCDIMNYRKNPRVAPTCTCGLDAALKAGR